MSVLAIDAGPDRVRAVVLGADGRTRARAEQHLREPGAAEVAAEELWSATLAAVRAVLGEAGDLTALEVVHHGETALLWDRETLGSPRPAMTGADRRTTELLTRLRDVEERVRALSGRPLDPAALAVRLRWVAETEPRTWALVEEGRYAVGSLESYLVARMTRGTWHVTDPGSAARTLLLDQASGDWSPELGALFGVPLQALPELVTSPGRIATTDARSFLGLELAITSLS